MTRQGYLKGVLLALCLQVLPWTAEAQPAYPTRPIRIITPFAAGQGPDVLLRNLAEKLGRPWGSRWWSTTGPGQGATSLPACWHMPPMTTPWRC